MINLTGELFIDGLWLDGHGDEFDSLHPVTDKTIWNGSAAGIEDVDAAVRAARKSVRIWRNTRFDERLDIVKAFGQLLEANKEALATLIGRETGKPLWESRTEVAAMIGKIGISEQAYNERTGTRESEVAAGHAVLRHRPHGVVAVFGPYNFPGTCPTATLCQPCWRVIR